MVGAREHFSGVEVGLSEHFPIREASQGGQRAPPVSGQKGDSGRSTLWAGPVQFYKKLLDGEKTVASRELTVEGTGGRPFFIDKIFYCFK